MATASIEDRLAILEKKVDRITAEHQRQQPDTPWWKKIVGVYKNDPEFDAAEGLGRAYRESLRPKPDVNLD